MSNAIAAPVWSYREANTAHAEAGLTYHPEAMAFRGATFAEIVAHMTRAASPVVATEDAAQVAGTVRPGR